MRIGIGNKGEKEIVNNYVMGDLEKEENEWMDKIMGEVEENVEMIERREDKRLMKRIEIEMGEGNKRKGGVKKDKEKLEKDKKKEKRNISKERKKKKKKNIKERGKMDEMMKKMMGKKD